MRPIIEQSWIDREMKNRRAQFIYEIVIFIAFLAFIVVCTAVIYYGFASGLFLTPRP